MTTRRMMRGDYSAVRCARWHVPAAAGRASPSSGRPTSTPRSRSRRWRPSSCASCPTATSGSTSRSGTASGECSRTRRASCACGHGTRGRCCATSPSSRPLGELLPPRSCLDGEIVIVRDGVLDFDAMQTRLHPAESRVRRLSAEIPASFVAFDVLVWDGEEHWRAPLAERRAMLETVGTRLHSSRPATLDRGEALELALVVRGDRARRRDRQAARRALPRGRAHAVVKVKPEKTADCVVAGVRWKSDGDRRIATLLLGLCDDDGDARLRRLRRGRPRAPRRDRRRRAAAPRGRARAPLLGAEPLGRRRARGGARPAGARRRGALRQGAGASLPARHEAPPASSRQGSGASARGASSARRSDRRSRSSAALIT